MSYWVVVSTSSSDTGHLVCVVGWVLHCLDQLQPVMWAWVCHLDLPIRKWSCDPFYLRNVAYRLRSQCHDDGGSVDSYSQLFVITWSIPIFSTNNKWEMTCQMLFPADHNITESWNWLIWVVSSFCYIQVNTLELIKYQILPVARMSTQYAYLNGFSLTVIIFPRNASFREYYVFVSNAAAAAASAESQFRCQRNNFWSI